MPRHLLHVAVVAASLLASPLPATATELPPAVPDHVTQQPSAVELPEVTDRVIIKYQATLTSSAKEQLVEDSAREVGVSAGEEVTELRTTVDGAQVVELADDAPAEQVEELAQELTDNPAVEWAEPDRLVAAAALPSDPHYRHQWGMQALDVPTAWDTATGTGTVIGVVDSGITGHQDLDVNSAGGYDFVSAPALSNDGNGRDSDPTDAGTYAVSGQCYEGSAAQQSSWHGTHVAGTAAANAHDGTGVVGVAPDAKILTARALGACNMGYLSDIAAAITWTVGAPITGVSPAGDTG